jgi:hypothetical protein
MWLILKQTYNFNDASFKTLSILHIEDSAETTTVNLLDNDIAVVDYWWKFVSLFLEFESYVLSDGSGCFDGLIWLDSVLFWLFWEESSF